MKIVRGSKLKYVPASHEDPKDPGVLKKVMISRDELVNGRIQMINWAKMVVGKSFDRHFHEDMEEVFIIMAGKVKVDVDGEVEMLIAGDAVWIPIKAEHEMWNIGKVDVKYLALGVSAIGKGVTVTV